MAEYIERQEAIDTVAWYREDPDGVDHALQSIMNIPAADVQPVIHSTWDKHGYSCPCLNCGYDFGYAGTPIEVKMKYEFKYCPSCGAKMTWKGGKDG